MIPCWAEGSGFRLTQNPDGRQKRLDDLYEYGKKKGTLTYKEIMERLMDLYIEPDQLDKVLDKLESLGVTVVEDHYDPQEFYSAVTGLENEPERGSRCTICYRLRMRRAAQYASENGFDWFTTTLSISPHKDAKRINAIGQELEAEFGVKHLPSDFKKHNGYLRSLQLSEEYGLYRQDYCGCEFSAKARGIEK